MSRSAISVGRVILQIALGLMLAVAGIWALQGGGDEGVKVFTSLFSKDLAKILKIVYGVIETVAGFFLILDLFLGDRLGLFGTILMIILIIIWIGVIVLCDFLGGNFLKGNFLSWCYTFANHLIVLGALIYLRF